MRPSKSQENILSSTYWRAQLVCKKEQAHTSSESPQEYMPFMSQGSLWPFLTNLVTWILKFVSTIFYQIFNSHELIHLQKLWKKLFLLKSFFHSRDIWILVFPASPLFLPVRHCFRGWSKINLKVYDVISCLNKNLPTHFVWYLEKAKSYEIETLSIDRVLNREHFYGKVVQKMCTKS